SLGTDVTGAMATMADRPPPRYCVGRSAINPNRPDGEPRGPPGREGLAHRFGSKTVVAVGPGPCVRRPRRSPLQVGQEDSPSDLPFRILDSRFCQANVGAGAHPPEEAPATLPPGVVPRPGRIPHALPAAGPTRRHGHGTPSRTNHPCVNPVSLEE